MDEEDEQQRYEEALQREYVKLKVELAQVQSDTERHKLMSTQLSSETDQLRSAIAQSQNAEREMRDLAKQLADEVSKLQREVKSKEEERDQVKAEAERTQEQRAQLEKTLEVLGGRKVTELLNSRRTNSQLGCFQDGASPAVAIDVSQSGVLNTRRTLLGHDASGTEQPHFEDSAVTGHVASADNGEGQLSTGTTRDPISTTSARSIDRHSARGLIVEKGDGGTDDGPSSSDPDAFVFGKGKEVSQVEANDISREKCEQVREYSHSTATASTSGRTSASAESRPSVASARSTDSLRMSVRDFMKGLDKEC